LQAGDRPEVIIKFARGGRSDGLPVPASVFSVVLPANYLCIRAISALQTLCYLLLPQFSGERNMSSAPLLIDNVDAQSRSDALKDRILPSLLAGALGLVLLYGAVSLNGSVA